MINNKRLKDVLASPKGMVMAILISIMVLFQFINAIITIVNSGMFAGLTAMLQLFALVAPVLLCVGIWVVFVSAKSEKMAKGGFTCLQVWTIIVTVHIGFSCLLIIFVALVGGIFGAGVLDTFEFYSGSAWVIVLCILLALCAITYMVFMIISCVKTMKMFSLIKRNERKANIKGTGFIKFGIIMFLLSGVLSFISAIWNIIVTDLSGSLIKEFFGEYASWFGMNVTSNIISGIFNALIAICEITLWVFAFIQVTNIRDAYNSGSGGTVEPPIPPSGSGGDGPPTTLLKEELGITCIRGENREIRYPIQDGEELIIGKDPQFAHIIVDSRFTKVSRKHCGVRYIKDRDEYQVKDYSSNGTFVKGNRRLAKGIYSPIPRGSVISLANEEVQFRLE